MGMQWTQPILRGVKITSFLLMTAIVSSLVVIESPRQTNAEGLLNTVVCTVGILLQKTCVAKPVETTVPPPQQQTPPPAETPQSTQPTPSTTPLAETQTQPLIEPTPEPLVLDEALKKELPPVPVQSVSRNSNQYPAHVLMSTYYRPNDGEVLGVSHESSYLEATDQGWRFFGLLWYWWVVTIAALVGLIYLIRTTVTKPFLSVVK